MRPKEIFSMKIYLILEFIDIKHVMLLHVRIDNRVFHIKEIFKADIFEGRRCYNTI